MYLDQQTHKSAPLTARSDVQCSTVTQVCKGPGSQGSDILFVHVFHWRHRPRSGTSTFQSWFCCMQHSYICIVDMEQFIATHPHKHRPSLIDHLILVSTNNIDHAVTAYYESRKPRSQNTKFHSHHDICNAKPRRRSLLSVTCIDEVWFT